jgi:RHS repeat-associated protein
VPIGGKTTAQENVALQKAIDSSATRKDQDDQTAIVAFLQRYPKSPWRAALLTNLGLAYRHTGWFLKALSAWEEAWRLSKSETKGLGKAVADRAFGELVELNARLGRRERVERLLKEIEGRQLIGVATEKVTAAREGVWMMYNEPRNAFKCGPFALARIQALETGPQTPPAKILEARSTEHGTSLKQVHELAKELGMDYQMAKRTPGSEVIIPSLVNWKANHFAALIREDHGRFLSSDPTFGDDILVTKAALDAESSGYFLVPNGPLPKGWQPVSATEADRVWGMGNTGDHDPRASKCFDDKAKPGCGSGTCGPMATYNFHTQLVSLNIMDTPVGYAPPRGPDMHFTITYNQRENVPSINHNRSNFGSKWVCNWIAYVDGPATSPNSTATVYLPGGGSEYYPPDFFTHQYPIGFQSGAVLTALANPPPPEVSRFERSLPDGTKQIFDLCDLIGWYGSYNFYMTKLIDAAGNTVTFNYDPTTFRLLSVTDALGQTTTITHLSNDPAVMPDFYLISQITDHFGRSAVFEYDTNKRLWKIHDPVGITSEFLYDGTGDFINTLTTPYGTTTFSQPLSPLDQWSNPGSGNARTIQAVDATGVERLEYGHMAGDNTMVPAVETNLPIVPGITIANGSYNYRNSFYWDKQATAMYPPDPNGVYDYTKAKLTHWLHAGYLPYDNDVSCIKERERMPFENAIYYFYAGQGDTRFTSSNGWPTKVARVLSGGSTQLWQYAYNSIGKMTQAIDPLNRVTSFAYDTNNVDLLTVYQRNPSGASTDPGGFAADIIEQHTYNSFHEPLTNTDAALQTTWLSYNSYGQIQTRENAKHEVTTFGYGDGSPGHPIDYLTSITSPPVNSVSAVTSFSYDSDNRVRTLTSSPDNYTVTTDYDDIDRPTQMTYPDGTTTQFKYTRYVKGVDTEVMTLDLGASKDRRGLWTYREYDANRHLTKITDPLNRPTYFSWCDCGSLGSITDANNHTTTFNRDLQGRVYQKVSQDNKAITYLYEGQSGPNTVGATSRLLSATDSKNQRTNYTYYADEDVWQITYTDTNGQPLNPPTPSVTFTYDTYYNRVATMSDGSGSTQYTYNSVPLAATLGAGQLQSIDGPLANDTITFGYDELGRVTNRSINGTANSQSWAFDSLGRLSSNTNKLGGFTYTYDGPTNRLLTLTYPGQGGAIAATANYTYFDNSEDRRLKEIQNLTNVPSPGGLLSQFDYTYDDEGQIKTWTKNYPGMSPAPQRYDLVYDNADQLTRAPLKNANNNNVITNYFYGYDLASNRTTERINTVTTTSTPNNVNEITSQSGGTNRTLSYDENGSLTNDGLTRTFEWDGANRLTAINYTSGNRSEFTYDGLSRCAKIVEKTNGSVTSTRKFVWCGNDKCEFRDANDAVTLLAYSQGQYVGSTKYFYFRDHLGSIREMMRANGTLVARFDYDPWGRSTTVLNTTLPDFNFTGLYRHSASNLDMAVHRFYDPELGRWINRDPIGEVGGVNLYGYAANVPLRFTDALGLLVDAYFNVQQGLLTVVDRDTGASITLPADSGEQGTKKNNNPVYENKQGGPTPRGDYEILNRLYNEPEKWSDLDELQASGVGIWALDRLDDTPRDDKGAGRGRLRLHPYWGTGCVVSQDLERWRVMRNIINHTRTQTVTDSNGIPRTLFGNMHVFSTTAPRAIFP